MRLNMVMVSLALIVPFLGEAHAQAVAGAGALATGLVLDKLSNNANQLINSATQSGNYLEGRAGIQASIAIENARQASQDVLGTALGDVQGERSIIIGNLNKTIGDLQAGTISATDALTQISNSGQQIANILDIQGHRSYVINYAPSVLYKTSENGAPVRIDFSGVNLDESQAQLRLDSTTYTPITVEKQALLFELPASAIEYFPNTSHIVQATLLYKSIKPGWINRTFGISEQIERQIALLALPLHLGTFEYHSRIMTTTRDTQHLSYTLQQFKGVNAEQKVTIQPPPGFRIDTSTLHFQPTGQGGGNSHCDGFPQEEAFEQGVTFTAWTGRTSHGVSADPGFVNCAVSYDIFRVVQLEADGPTKSGQLSWYSDQPIHLDSGTKSFLLSIKTFDGRQRTFSAAGHDDFFDVLQDTDVVVIHPLIPPHI